MDVVIVFKADGTTQCCDEPPIPLEHHAAELRLIGAKKICGEGNVPGPFIVIDLCGAPTGGVNAFTIAKVDWEAISRGIVGTLGFRLWTGAPYPPLEINDDCVISPDRPMSGPGISASIVPVLIRKLLGRPCH